MQECEQRGDACGPGWRCCSRRPAVAAPLPLLLTPLTLPMALPFGILLLRPLDHFLRVEWRTTRSRAFLARLRFRHDEHHRHVDDDAGAFGEDGGQDEDDADDRDLYPQVRRETVADAGDHRAVGIPIQSCWPWLCV